LLGRGARVRCALLVPLVRSARVLVALPLVLAACSSPDELILVNQLEWPVSLEVRAPQSTLRGGCNTSFETRFCADQYEAVGVLDIGAKEERTLAISDPVTATQCTNILWLRLVRLDDVGPVDDPGTLIDLPADVEIEEGAGALHSVAFPQATVRIDEVGLGDLRQAGPASPCAP
jgi:hypothetical protein